MKAIVCPKYGPPEVLQIKEVEKPAEVLIYGAFGTTGTTAIQFARYLGAKVTAVCSTANLELVKSLGADKVIDYTKEDMLSPGIEYDFILDAVGKSKSSKSSHRQNLSNRTNCRSTYLCGQRPQKGRRSNNCRS